MGDDSPLAAFSTKQRNFSDFFKQKFAQVTNPPIDPIREKVVMSLNTGFGETRNILSDDAEHAKRLKTVSPILSLEKLELLKAFGDERDPKFDPCYKAKSYDTTFSSDLKGTLAVLVETIISDVKNEGIRTIVLDDRVLDANTKVMPMLMVVGRLNQALLEAGERSLVSIVAATGEVYDSHMAACMLGFGVAAIYPYMLYQTVAMIEHRKDENVNLAPILKKVRKSINAGLLKIMSKMGISTMSSYRNSKLFDVLGLSDEIVSECFTGAYGFLSGLTYEDIEARITKAHDDAYAKETANRIFPLNIGGFYKYLDGAEFHDYSPATVHAIHTLSKSGKKEDFDTLKELVDGRDKKFIRDFFELKSDREAISVDEVEPLSEVFKRFSTAAMSLGSISPEAHECLAEAMNTIGGSSNSGEGGEDAVRFGTIKNR
jgi:glutamate synthase (NADPH/NADH) large chain